MRLSNQRTLSAMIVVLGLLPVLLRSAGFGPAQPIGIAAFIVNLAVCVLGARAGYRLPWLVYAAGCVVSFALFGMSSPISLLLTVLVH